MAFIVAKRTIGTSTFFVDCAQVSLVTIFFTAWCAVFTVQLYLLQSLSFTYAGLLERIMIATYPARSVLVTVPQRGFFFCGAVVVF